MNETEWSIQDLASAAGITSRTLRHYGDVGLLAPSRVGRGGYRYYDQAALVRLQRILLLRELGLGLPAIRDVLEGDGDTAAALRTHLQLLEQELDRVQRQITSVRTTLRKTETGEALMATEALDGFDQTQYEDEIIERWGQQAYDDGDRWWTQLSAADQGEFGQRHLDIAADYGRALAAGAAPDSDEVQAIAERHYQWVVIGWQGRKPDAPAFTGLGEMYVADPRFAQNYDRHGDGAAVFVRDAMKVYAERNLS